MAALFFSFLLSSSFLPRPAANNPQAPVVFYPDWVPGVVVLETNDTVTCQLRYSQIVPEGLLQVMDRENVLTLSVKDVKCFFYYDSISNRYRKFYTLSVPIKGDVPREMFLEYIYGNNKVSILNHKTMGTAHAAMEFHPFKHPVPVNRQYLLDCRTGKVLPMSEENAMSFVDRKKPVVGFIEAEKIRFRKLSDYVRVFEYEQSL